MENESGVHPENDLVLLQEIPVRREINGIALTDDLIEKEQHAQTQSIFVSAGEKAMELPRIARKKSGQLVMFGRYAGWRYIGKDGKWYRLVRADDVVAELDEYVEQTTLRGRVSTVNKGLDTAPRLVVSLPQ